MTKANDNVQAAQQSDDDSSENKVLDTLSSEIQIFAESASIFFKTFSELHKASAGNKGNRSVTDVGENHLKSSKAAWKHWSENSAVHKENLRQAKRVLPDSVVDDFHSWADDSGE